MELTKLINLFILFGIITAMSDKQEQDKVKELTKDFSEEDIKNLNPDNLIVNIGGKQVPFNKINKPHAVVLNPDQHKPIPNAQDFPDLTEEAKKREAERK